MFHIETLRMKILMNVKIKYTHCYHCHLICIKGHVETVDTKDQSNAIVYGMFVDTVDTKIKPCKCIDCYVCRDCRYWCLWLLHNTLYRVL